MFWSISSHFVNDSETMEKPLYLIADSGSTKTTWCLLSEHEEKTILTQGISPYFLSAEQIAEVLKKELLPSIDKKTAGAIKHVYFYGTGLADKRNARLLCSILQATFPDCRVDVDHDLMGAALALCGHNKGIACILGTGSNSCYFNGKKIVKNNPGLGFILGDEGSGAFLGKMVVQYYLYGTFDEQLQGLFDRKYHTDKDEILENVYRRPYPNRYLAQFTYFLGENRGHYMVENILEDGLHEFFFRHVYKYAESWKFPVHFTGGIAWTFRDVIEELCRNYGLQQGTIIKTPMEGLITYHRGQLRSAA